MTEGSLQQLLDDIKAQIAAGRMIEAIKLYRDATGAGLAEAKEAVELIAAGKPPKDSATMPRPDDAAMRDVESAIMSGQKIEAIRLYRQSTGLDLKSAKEAVDALEIRINPEAVVSKDAAMRRIRRMALIMLLVVAGFVLLISVLFRWS